MKDGHQLEQQQQQQLAQSVSINGQIFNILFCCSSRFSMSLGWRFSISSKWLLENGERYTFCELSSPQPSPMPRVWRMRIPKIRVTAFYEKWGFGFSVFLSLSCACSFPRIEFSKMWLYCFVPHRFNVRIVKYVCMCASERVCVFLQFPLCIVLCACVYLLFALGLIRFGWIYFPFMAFCTEQVQLHTDTYVLCVCVLKNSS